MIIENEDITICVVWLFLASFYLIIDNKVDLSCVSVVAAMINVLWIAFIIYVPLKFFIKSIKE